MELKKYKLADIADFNKSSISRSETFKEIIYLDTSSITENVVSGTVIINTKEAPSRAQRKVTNNTIIYSTVRPRLKHYGILRRPQNNFIVSTGFATIDIKDLYKDKIDPRYLYLLLTQPAITNYIGNIADTAVSAYPSINPSDLSSLCFMFPDYDIQKTIADIWNNYDYKIEINRAINQNLEAITKQLYDYWFVQFDFPNEEGKPYKSSGGKMIWNDKLKRESPVGWHCGNLLEIAVFTNGLACQKFRPKDGELPLPVIKIREMHEGISADTEKVTPNIPESVKVYNGDVLFSWSASLEVMLWAYGLGGLNQHIFKVTSANDFPKSFYYFQLLNYVDVFKKMAEARKTTMGHITQDHLQQSTIAIPDNKDIADRFEELISPIFNQIIKLQEEIIDLTRQRNELLPLLMSGQVSVNSDLSDD